MEAQGRIQRMGGEPITDSADAGPPGSDPDADGTSTTSLLRAARAGNSAAFDQLFARVYHELARVAHRVRRRSDNETLDTTALVHETYLKLLPARDAGGAWNDRAHFLGIAARAMRQVLVNAAEARMTEKRGGRGAVAVPIDDFAIAAPVRPEHLLALDEALARLAALDDRQARVVEARVFAGLTAEETAEALGISVPTVQRDWRAARAWLARALAPTA
ncbi:MAG TPA: ECF-type sigma factor [Gemmatirosa sp.]